MSKLYDQTFGDLNLNAFFSSKHILIVIKVSVTTNKRKVAKSEASSSAHLETSHSRQEAKEDKGKQREK